MIKEHSIQKQSPDVLCKKGVHKHFAKFTRKHLCQSLFFNKVAELMSEALFKKRFWHCEFCEIFKTTFFTAHFWIICVSIAISRYRYFYRQNRSVKMFLLNF